MEDKELINKFIEGRTEKFIKDNNIDKIENLEQLKVIQNRIIIDLLHDVCFLIVDK